MKTENTMDILKDGHLVIPLFFYKNYINLKLTLEEFIFLMYLYNQGPTAIFNPNKISNDLNIELNDVMNLVDILTKKHFIRVEVTKNDKNIMEERINLDDFYRQLTKLIAALAAPKVDATNIFELVEKEFGRTLSPMEYEIIKAWLENNTSEELIREALKEAVYNGVNNLRYIDKILYEWGKKGFKTKEDISKYQSNRRNSNKEEIPPLFEYDWFDDDESKE
ncbi:MAG: DnaD domain protein [Bacilli bacterium]